MNHDLLIAHPNTIQSKRFDLLYRSQSVAIKPLFALILILVIINCLGCARDGNSPPELLSLQDYQLNTNENFQLEITGRDPDQDFIEFNFSISPPPPTPTETSGGVPSLLRLDQTKATFTWTPGSADTGRYILTVWVEDPFGARAEESLTLTVIESTSGGGVWAQFIEPQSNATVVDLNESPCLEVDITLRSDQISAEEILVALIAPSPESAMLVPTAPKSYHLSWCPRPEEVAVQTNFPFVIRATTTRGLPPIDKRYLVRIRTQASENCPGQPPELTHEPPPPYSGVSNIRLALEVRDDLGIKSAPTVSYQIAPINATQPLADAWETALLTSHREAGPTHWIAQLPPPQDPMGSIVFYHFLVNDDDDPSGTRCDHSVESDLYQLTYRWDPSQTETAEMICASCIDDLQCGGVEDLCLQTSQGGICGLACSELQRCPPGFQCESQLTTSGESAMQCVSLNACGSACRADQYEVAISGALNNDLPTQSTSLMNGVYTNLTICEGDNDYYRIPLAMGQSLTARIEFDPQVGDLDLEVSDTSPTGLFPILRSTSSINPFEEVVVSCVAQDTSALVRVHGFEGAQNEYTLILEVSDQPCSGETCYPDEHEGFYNNDVIFSATFASLNVSYEGQICPQDLDIYRISLEEAVTTMITLEVNDPNHDLTFDLLDEEGGMLREGERQPDGSVRLDFTPPMSREYYVKVLSLSGSANTPYRLSLGSESDACTSTYRCPLGTYCDPNGECIPNACESLCQSNHACLSPLAGRAPLGASGICAPICELDTDCRMGERCKAFESFTRRCAPAGSTLTGGSCNSFSDCAGDAICIPTNGGYCASAACIDHLDCAPDTLCASLVGISSCVKRCEVDGDCGRPDLSCRDLPEGRACVP